MTNRMLLTSLEGKVIMFGLLGASESWDDNSEEIRMPGAHRPRCVITVQVFPFGKVEMLQRLLSGADRFVVVDAETTGLYNSDRIVEVAAVTVSGHGRIVDEWDTLIDPQRDVGPTHIHRITASMVSAAPTFAEIASALSERLQGAVVVAHNLTFDTRMLIHEYERHNAALDPGDGLCTLRLAGERLGDACHHHGIPFEFPHRALADARATAHLLRFVADKVHRPTRPANVTAPASLFRPRTLRRDMTAHVSMQMPYLARLADRLHHYGERDAALVYMDLLDWALADLEITRDEQSQLTGLAIDLGLDLSDIDRVHYRYMDELIAAAARDEIITDAELEILGGAATALRVEPAYIAERIAGWRPVGGEGLVTLIAGMKVCFTGAACYPDGSELPRDRLNRIASDLGLVPVDSVTKTCNLLAASDPTSQSGKAVKARKLGIPIISVADLLQAGPSARLPTRF